ncbi:hypothetical protein H5410_059799, partial [Solanum commersonii]
MAKAYDRVSCFFLKKVSRKMGFSNTLEYEKQSGQKMNKENSFFYLHHNVAAGISQEVEHSISTRKGVFPMKYLGYPITHGRKRKEHYSKLLNRVKEVLLSSVLQCTLIYTLSIIIPPTCVIKELHRIFARFFGVIRKQ